MKRYFDPQRGLDHCLKGCSWLLLISGALLRNPYNTFRFLFELRVNFFFLEPLLGFANISEEKKNEVLRLTSKLDSAKYK